MLGLIDNFVDRMSEEARSYNGQFEVDALPMEVWELAVKIFDDMKSARYGNHFGLSVAASMPFLQRICNMDGYENGRMPIMYLRAFGNVAQDWAERHLKATGKLPAENPEYAPLILAVNKHLEELH